VRSHRSEEARKQDETRWEVDFALSQRVRDPTRRRSGLQLTPWERVRRRNGSTMAITPPIVRCPVCGLLRTPRSARATTAATACPASTRSLRPLSAAAIRGHHQVRDLLRVVRTDHAIPPRAGYHGWMAASCSWAFIPKPRSGPGLKAGQPRRFTSRERPDPPESHAYGRCEIEYETPLRRSRSPVSGTARTASP
jgi:hypothetical protein